MENDFTRLTQNQKLLWIGQELNPDSPMYNMVMTYEIGSLISLPHFRSAFKLVVAKNDALRSVFETRNDEPVQRYLPEMDHEVEFVDFSKDVDAKKAYSLWEQERAHRLFNLEQCLFDSVLIKLADDRFIWYINQHHLITDGWSTTILFSQICEAYQNVLAGQYISDESYPSYKEFVAFERDAKKSEKHSTTLQHWEEKKKLFPLAPALYHNKATSLQTSSKRIHLNLGKKRSGKIQALANLPGIKGWSQHLTYSNIFLTAIYAFIYRISDQEKLVIGTPTHNRLKKDFKQTLGYFVETFPLLVEIEDDETFFSLFRKTQIESNSFLKNARTGTSSPQLNRDFNLFYNYMSTGSSDFHGAPVKTSWVHPGHTDPRHHIRFHVHDFDNTGEIQLYFDLNTHIFDEDLQARIPRHFLNLLDALIEDHEQKINSVNFIAPGEVALIKTWNNTSVEYAKEETLLTKFQTQVQRVPDYTAIIFRESSLSYKSLDEKSNQVARFLREKDVQSNDIVAVSMDRSLEMMIYIYGIIKAGAAYLPLDVKTPTQRLKFIIENAKIKTLFYNHENLSDATILGTDLVDVSRIKDKVNSLDTAPLGINVNQEDLAYVIYTSGSTGEPKGVMCHHGGICNRLQWMNNDYPITSADTFLQKTPITFDVSLWELFWPLQEGATLVVEEPNGHMDPAKLAASIDQHQVTQIHFVPSMLNVFVQSQGINNCKSLKRIFCSGEALSVPVVKKTYSQLEQVEIHNLYGPTEASVDVTSWHCKKEDLDNGIPIGRPVPNTQLYILDDQLNQLPIGLKGELYIAGKQVAKGYLNNSVLTAERFIKDPFSVRVDTKMYKTGDVVRYTENGVIEYHGRVDNQIKLRGLRIELGEIEKSLEKLAQISQAVVTVDDQDNLVAYLLGETIKDSAIINALKQHLPEYMIPHAYYQVDRFELLSSGKVNRKALPKPDTTLRKNALVVEVPLVAPNTEIEEIVFAVWKEIIGNEQLGVHQNFLRIGGNSLDAITITSRLRSILELEVSITDVFNYPTIASYSKNIEEVMTRILSEYQHQ